ncbi:MAG: TonB-dependent receptor [Cytophagaceae bacterium]|nr:TonB-dependent receptor [Cytophagaceae bacterium]|tara:strand:- start:12793 stop:15570 length:2778 start_codon:yes stop_codon:yes gene_type:complete
MKNVSKLLVAAFFVLTAVSYGQGTLTGTVLDGDMNAPLPGVNVMVQGTNAGASTDFDGNFNLEVTQSTGTLRISYVGFKTLSVPFNVTGGGTQDLGDLVLEVDANSLDEVVVTGVVDIAKDRETPVAVSTIRAAEIQEKLGSQEFPEILNNTPSIYATKQGGGYGDSRINIRGFSTRNSAVMINGIPVNDMENGAVYWSNWAGLSDVASAIQVQRGLGSSKLTVSSVGGTINVVTRSADRAEGGFVSASAGNDGYNKTVVSYNTGINEKGWSSSYLFSRTAGDGYVDGTNFEGYNYYIGVGYKASASHDFNFMITGAPQQHNQRSFAPSIGDYIQYGNGTDPDIRYNSDWGSRNGEQFTFGGNFYHKPIASLNWDWKINSTSKLSTSAYASFGRGGSIGGIGRVNGDQSYSLPKVDNGLVPIDDIIAYNSGQLAIDGTTRAGYTGGGDEYQGQFVNGNNSPSAYASDAGFVYGAQNGISQRSSVNSHNWFGLITNYETQLSEFLTLNAGLDFRKYTGYHYRRLVNLLGADAYVDSDNINDPYRFLTETYKPTILNTVNVFKSIDDEEKIDYYNDGKVGWQGAFGQLEYNNDVISAFVQGSISNQSFQRIDYFNYLDSDPEQESDVENIIGGNIKGGVNWNIDEMHNVFVNGGYYSKQPLFDAVFPSFVSNDVNKDLQNEKIVGLEVGYGFRSPNFRGNVNLYRTSWADRFETVSAVFNEDTDDEIRGSANVNGITQVHMGVEVDFVADLMHNLRINGMLSVANWEYKDNPTATYFDESNQPILIDGVAQTETLELDGIKVGDAAQFTASLGAAYDIIEFLTVDASYRFADNLYADYDATSVGPDGALKLPSFGLLDAGVSFKVPSLSDLSFRLNVNNVTNETYISESDTNYFVRDGDDTYDGISTGNRVFFGLGRTWNASVRYRF